MLIMSNNKDINDNNIDNLIYKIKELDSQYKIINKKLDNILEILEKDVKKMSDHIDFVENVYENIKSPFHYVMNRVNYMVTGTGEKIKITDIANSEDNKSLII